ncbi:MAG: glycoside hydrolase family 25 protein [Lachnospiraceae bacterium]|nr:glycoside hydrolase family 25 protein [Lachnospiraceae bacterium]
MKLHEVEFEEIPVEETSANKYTQAPDVMIPHRNRKPGKGLFVVGLVFLLLSVTVFAASYLIFVKEIFKKPEPVPEPVITYTQEELDAKVAAAVMNAEAVTSERVSNDYRANIFEASQINGGMNNYLRYLFPDNIIFMEGSKYVFAPLHKGLKQSKVESSLFKMDDTTGFLSYINVDGTVSSHIGVDVSKFQQDIDWNRVKNAGIEFAIIRCGIRGYGSEGRLAADSKFEDNISGAIAAGLPVGVYFFTQALTKEEAVEEAEYVLSLIEPYNVTGPIVLDVETASSEERTKNQTPAERTDCIIAFCDRIKQAGKTPMIYSNIKYFVRMMEIERLEEYKKWYANYNSLFDPETFTSPWAFNDPLYFPYEFSMWQYTESGQVDGIPGKADLNVLFEKWW